MQKKSIILRMMEINSTNTQNKLRFISAIFALVLSIALFIYSLGFISMNKQKTSVAHILPPNTFENLNLKAKAAYVFEPQTKTVLFKKNETLQLPLASITKIMTTLVARDYVDEKQKIKFADKNWRVEDLINYVLMVSSNDGAKELASVAMWNAGYKNKTFIDLMNEKAKLLGLNQTYFLDEAGLDVSDTQSGGYGSAKDVAKMFAYAIKRIPNDLDATAIKDTWFRTDSEDQPAINTNKALNSIPGFFAGKTGYTYLAGGNLVVAFDPGFSSPVVAVVLGSTKEGRFDDIKKLVNATIKQKEFEAKLR